jgi:hypothetical protein
MCKVVTPRDPEFPHKLRFQGTQTATTATERRTTQLLGRGTGDFAQIPKSVTSKRQWRRSAPSDDTCTRKRKNRVEPSIYQLPQKSLASFDVEKPTLTADKRKNGEPAGAFYNFRRAEVKLSSPGKRKRGSGK